MHVQQRTEVSFSVLYFLININMNKKEITLRIFYLLQDTVN